MHTAMMRFWTTPRLVISLVALLVLNAILDGNLENENRHLQIQEARGDDVTQLQPSLGNHYVTLYVGSPAQPQRLMVSLASDFTSFPCTGCKNCGDHHVSHIFDFNNSLVHQCPEDCMFKQSRCEDGSKKCFVVSDQHEEDDTEGSYRGFEVRDTVYLDVGTAEELPKNSQGVVIDFICQSNIRDMTQNRRSDGMLSLSMAPSSFINQLRARGKIGARKFSLCFNQIDQYQDDGASIGSVQIGNIKNHHYSSALVWAKNTGKASNINGNYAVRVKKLYLGHGGGKHPLHSAAQGTMTVIPVVTETDNVFVPPEAWLADADIQTNKAHTQLPKNFETAFQKTFSKVAGFSYDPNGISLDQHKMSLLPTLFIQIEPHLHDQVGIPFDIPGFAGRLDKGNHYDVLLAIPPHSYFIYDNETHVATPTIQFSDKVSFLGANVLQGHEVVFDLDNKRIGFAQHTSCEPSLSLLTAVIPAGKKPRKKRGKNIMKAMTAGKSSEKGISVSADGDSKAIQNSVQPEGNGLQFELDGDDTPGTSRNKGGRSIGDRNRTKEYTGIPMAEGRSAFHIGPGAVQAAESLHNLNGNGKGSSGWNYVHWIGFLALLISFSITAFATRDRGTGLKDTKYKGSNGPVFYRDDNLERNAWNKVPDHDDGAKPKLATQPQDDDETTQGGDSSVEDDTQEKVEDEEEPQVARRSLGLELWSSSTRDMFQKTAKTGSEVGRAAHPDPKDGSQSAWGSASDPLLAPSLGLSLAPSLDPSRRGNTQSARRLDYNPSVAPSVAASGKGDNQFGWGSASNISMTQSLAPSSRRGSQPSWRSSSNLSVAQSVTPSVAQSVAPSVVQSVAPSMPEQRSQRSLIQQDDQTVASTDASHFTEVSDASYFVKQRQSSIAERPEGTVASGAATFFTDVSDASDFAKKRQTFTAQQQEGTQSELSSHASQFTHESDASYFVKKPSKPLEQTPPAAFSGSVSSFSVTEKRLDGTQPTAAEMQFYDTESVAGESHAGGSLFGSGISLAPSITPSQRTSYTQRTSLTQRTAGTQQTPLGVQFLGSLDGTEDETSISLENVAPPLLDYSNSTSSSKKLRSPAGIQYSDSFNLQSNHSQATGFLSEDSQQTEYESPSGSHHLGSGGQSDHSRETVSRRQSSLSHDSRSGNPSDHSRESLSRRQSNLSHDSVSRGPSDHGREALTRRQSDLSRASSASRGLSDEDHEALTRRQSDLSRASSASGGLSGHSRETESGGQSSHSRQSAASGDQSSHSRQSAASRFQSGHSRQSAASGGQSTHSRQSAASRFQSGQSRQSAAASRFHSTHSRGSVGSRSRSGRNLGSAASRSRSGRSIGSMSRSVDSQGEMSMNQESSSLPGMAGSSSLPGYSTSDDESMVSSFQVSSPYLKSDDLEEGDDEEEEEEDYFPPPQAQDFVPGVSETGVVTANRDFDDDQSFLTMDEFSDAGSVWTRETQGSQSRSTSGRTQVSENTDRHSNRSFQRQM